jgi:signal transduction histidine kinase
MNRRITAQQQGLLNDERLRISRDIHDNLGARLTEIILLSDLAQRSTARGAEVETHVGNLSKIAREVVQDLDAIVWAVNPKHDFVDSFATYLCQYVERFLGVTPIRFRFDFSHDLPHLPLSAETRQNLFLVAKEALNNVAKHSGASEVWVRVNLEDGWLKLEITDNGRGFQTAVQLERGNGLGNMEDRIKNIGGRSELISHVGRGTSLRIAAPITATPATAPRVAKTLLQAA